jgi:predicted negative regulator of RcsB-dependent stress response
LLGLALLFGGKSWFAWQDRNAENASNIYATMMAALGNGEEKLVNEKAGRLIADYTSTPYAPLAALALAKTKLAQGELVAARTQLQWALEHTDSDVIRDTVRLRLARVMVAENDLDGAAALISQDRPESAFSPLYGELRGDIQLARGDMGNARAEYERALAGMSGESPGRQLLQLKYDNAAPAAGSGDSQ